MVSDYRSLLELSRLIYEKHQGRNPQVFNVFSVLRSDSDEVHLHSRFLHALLDYQPTPLSEKENLKHFLNSIGIDQFGLEGVRVAREKSNVDILVTNSSGQAIAIENKIYADDQYRQLERYWRMLDGRGYKSVFLVYLTLDGRHPSDKSLGELGELKERSDESRQLICCSYREDIADWLTGCQQRACEEPALRESISQYLKLVRKLTGTDMNDEQRKELSSLLKKDNNLQLAYDLRSAMVTTLIDLQVEIWNDIESAMVSRIPGLPPKSKTSDTSRTTVKKFYTKSRDNRFYGLFYQFASGAAKLGIDVDSKIGFGVVCHKERDAEEYLKLKMALDGLGGKATTDWPLYKNNGLTSLNLKEPSRGDLKTLSDPVARRAYAEEIAEAMSHICDVLEEAGYRPFG